MYILGIDYGEKNIGLAYSNGDLAVPVKVVHNIESVLRFIAQNKIEKIVVGIPVDVEGNEGLQAMKVRNFVEELKVRLRHSMDIEFQNERLTSEEALNKLKQQDFSKKKIEEKIDALAAAIILQDWIDSREQ